MGTPAVPRSIQGDLADLRKAKPARPIADDLAAIRAAKPKPLVTSHPPTPQLRPTGILSRAGGAIADMARDIRHHPEHLITQPIEAFRDTFVSPVIGEQRAQSDYLRGKGIDPIPSVPYGGRITASTPGAITPEQQRNATIQTIATMVAGKVGSKLAEPLSGMIGRTGGQFAGRTTANFGVGAVTNPTDPLVGGISNVVTGEALHKAGGKLAKVSGEEPPVAPKLPFPRESYATNPRTGNLTFGRLAQEQADAVNAGHSTIRDAPADHLYVTAQRVSHAFETHRAEFEQLGYTPEKLFDEIGQGITDIHDGGGKDNIIMSRHRPEGRLIEYANLLRGEEPKWHIGSGHPEQDPAYLQGKTRLWPTAPEVGPGSDLSENLRRSSEEIQSQPRAEEGLSDPVSRHRNITPSGDGTEYRHSGLGLIPAQIAKIKNAVRGAIGSPYAALEDQHPALVNALNTAGASAKAASHIADRRAGWVMENVNPEQRGHFGKKLVHDNMVDAAQRLSTAAEQLGETDAIDAVPKKSARDLWYTATTPSGKLRNIAEMETEPLISELVRRTQAQKRYYKDLRRYGPTSAVTRNNEVRIGQIDDLLTKRDGLDQDAVWNEVKRRTEAGDEGNETDFSFSDDDGEPLKFPLHEPEPEAAVNRKGFLQAAHRFAGHADELAQQLPEGIENEPWFKEALVKHKEHIEPTLTRAAIGSGVNPESFRNPASAYLRLISEDRLHNKEVRRAMDATETANPGDLSPRSAFMRKILGENPALHRLFPDGANDLRVGPLVPGIPSTGTDIPIARQGATRTGSAKQATGTAREYVTDYDRIIRQDAHDKIVKAAKNKVYAEIAQIGRKLGPKEEPALGKKAVQRTVLDENGQPTVERWEVEPKVQQALDRFERLSNMTDQTGVWRKFNSRATRFMLSGMPVEATSHMNTLASIVGAIPGELDHTGRAISALPGIGGKAAAIREMIHTDFSDPKIRALESRLADIGAMRIDDDSGGIVNTAHHALFGPEGVDIRGRLALARKYLALKPEATDAELRHFVTSKLGNYVRANSGTLVNAFQDAGMSSFARFQAARIPTGIATTFGRSGLPAANSLQRAKNVAGTLYRGPLGYAALSGAANYALTGHGPQDNERGHQTDIQLPFTIGPHNRPAYIPTAFLNPLVATGLRATGIRDFLPFPGHPNAGGMISDAARDMENTALGVASPAVRALSIAASGRTPYLNSDGSMLRVTDPRFDKGSQMMNNVKAAFSLGNPALSAFATHGGDVGGNTLSDALTVDGQPLGGWKSAASRVAEFVLPRVATVGVGGTDAETSQLHRDERDYMETINSYKSRLRRAPGPVSQNAIIEEAVKDATSDGRFRADVVRQELERYKDTPQGKRDRTKEKADSRFTKRKGNR